MAKEMRIKKCMLNSEFMHINKKKLFKSEKYINREHFDEHFFLIEVLKL